MNAFTEQLIVHRFRTGDAEAFGELFDQYHEAIFRYLAVRCGTREDAEDLASLAFERLMNTLLERPIRNIKPFLFKIARNLLIDHYRSNKRPATVSLEAAEPFLTTGEFEKDPHERAQLLNALQSLPDDYRDVLLLHYLEGLSTREIADVMDRSNGAVRVLLHRARASLKQNLPIK